jgi:hypothetical protein
VPAVCLLRLGEIAAADARNAPLQSAPGPRRWSLAGGAAARSGFGLAQALDCLPDRVGDPRIVRLIQKWLKAGVSEEGQWSETKVGTPQGAVNSPLLANIYLHYVFDLCLAPRPGDGHAHGPPVAGW